MYKRKRQGEGRNTTLVSSQKNTTSFSPLLPSPSVTILVSFSATSWHLSSHSSPPSPPPPPPLMRASFFFTGHRMMTSEDSRRCWNHPSVGSASWLVVSTGSPLTGSLVPVAVVQDSPPPDAVTQFAVVSVGVGWKHPHGRLVRTGAGRRRRCTR